jgi:hypothetical protein
MTNKSSRSGFNSSTPSAHTNSPNINHKRRLQKCMMLAGFEIPKNKQRKK